MPTNFGTGFGPSFGNTGWNNQLQTPTKQQKFPGLSDDQIKRLESLTSDPQEQQKLYQQAIALKSERDMNDNRMAAENEMTYRSMGEKDIRQSNYMQSNVRLEQLADLTKKKFGLNANADTQGVINGLMQYAQDKGVSMDSLNDYLAGYNERFLYDTGLKEETTAHKIGQVGTDIVGGAYDSATSLPRMLGKGVASAIGWAAKQFGADEDRVNALVQSYKDYLDNDMSSKDIGANQESTAYAISKGAGDLAQVVAGEGALKSAVQGTAKGGQLLKYLENAPTWQKMVAGSLEGAGDMVLYSIVADNKLPTAGETGVGAAIGAAIPLGGAVYKAAKPLIKKGTQKAAAKLELSGMLNPAKLNTIKNQLIEEGTDLAAAGLKGGTAEDVGTWMIERGFKGDKPTIISDLGTHAKKAHDLKREVLGASETLHNVESAKKSLNIIHDTIQDVPGLETRLARVEELMGKEQHTLSELDEIKSILDDTKNLYTNTGNPKAGAINEGLIKVRQDLRKYIEDAAEKEGLGNVKLLNNETQVAKGLQDAISRKDSADAAREMLSVFSKSAIGGAAGYNVGPFDNDTLGGKIGNIVVGALAGKYLFSTKAKTQFASLINKMSGASKKELERLVAGDLSVKKLSNKTQKELEKVFQESGIMEAGVPTELTPVEYEALLKKYSNSDLPALEFKEGVDDAGKNILAGDSEKIIATPEGVNFREGQVAELPTKNVNYIKETLKEVGLSDEQVEKVINNPKFREAWHGGAELDKFDLNKVSEDVGEQIHGWGTYFSKSDDVDFYAEKAAFSKFKGKQYADLENGKALVFNGDNDLLKGNNVLYDFAKSGNFKEAVEKNIKKYEDFVKKMEETKDDYISKWSEDTYNEIVGSYKDNIEKIKKIKESDFTFDDVPKKHKYKVGLSNEGQWLQEQGKLSKQEQKEMYDKLYEEMKNRGLDYKELKKELESFIKDDATGYELYSNIAYELGGQKEASLFLRDLGYNGIEYPDGFVSFNPDKNATILEHIVTP